MHDIPPIAVVKCWRNGRLDDAYVDIDEGVHAYTVRDGARFALVTIGWPDGTTATKWLRLDRITFLPVPVMEVARAVS